jgi:trehalose-6-phosphate synthase
MDKHRLIVVSSRQPYEHRWERNQLVCVETDGWVTAALDAVLRRHGGTETIKEALEMPLDERRRRICQMRSYLAAHDICVDGCLHDASVGAQT